MNRVTHEVMHVMNMNVHGINNRARLGHLLRVDEDHIVRKTMQEHHAMWMEGRKDNLLMDASRGLSMGQLKALAMADKDKKVRWHDMVRQLH